MNKKVVKFGGSSLANSEQFKKAASIIRSDAARRFIVVSAPGKRFDTDRKVTDLLAECYEEALKGESFDRALNEVGERFQEIITGLDLEFDLTEELGSLREHLTGGSPSRDFVLSRGEYYNARIMALLMGYSFVDSADCIHFDDRGVPEASYTNESLSRRLDPLENAVIPGFYGSGPGPKNEIVTFSRGGSDITGSLVAKAIGADIYENWTDVSGLLAADPGIIENPRTVNYISYRELRILSYMGATVLHADAVYPVNQAGIPVNIRNTNEPLNPGTMIVHELPAEREKHTITGVAGRKGLSVIQVEKVMVSDGAGFTAVILDIFKALGVPFEQCLTGIDTVTLVVRADYFKASKAELMRAIEEQLKPDKLFVHENLAMIAVVGESDADYQGSTVTILSAVSKLGIDLNTINQGAGSLNLIIGVNEADYERAICAIYNSI